MPPQMDTNKESNSAKDDISISESGSTSSNDDAFNEFLSFISAPEESERGEIVIEEEKDEDEGTHQTSISNTISALAAPTSFFPHSVDEGEVWGIDSSGPSTSLSTCGSEAGVNLPSAVIEDLEAGGTPNRPQHTETDTSSNPDPFIVEAFQRYDTDGNGELSSDEVKELLQSLGFGASMEEEENYFDRWIQKVDKDGNGSIDFEEFLSIFNNMKGNSVMDIDKLLLETFQQYDADGSGAIDVGELKTLMAQLGHDLSDEQLSIMINKVDQDGNGEIDFEEFVDLFKMEVPGDNSKKKKRSGSILMMENSEAPSVREAKQGPERRRASITSSLCDSIDPTALNRHVIEETWNNAKLLISFNRMLQIVTWLYSQRKMILLACSHFVATVIIWSHYAMVRFEQQENDVSEDASRYWAKRVVPPFLFGSKHAILFQMALIPFTMSRYTIASLSNSKLNDYLPLNKSMSIHIYLGYTMVCFSIMATVIFFAFLGLLCSEGEGEACDNLTSEIMITGYCIMALLLFMAGTALYRHTIPYEIFYRVHYTFLVVYSLTIAHTVDAAHRSGEKDRNQTFKWFVVPLLYYFCDYAMMWIHQRFKTRITSFTAVEGHDGSKMIILKMQRPTLFVFQPGQYAFLRVDYIDRSWHPFSIASEPDSSIVEFYIEVFGEGSWTERLWKKLNSQNKRQTLNIELMGPYGTALIQGQSYTNVVAVGSGTGIVPCISLLKQHVRTMLMMDPENYLINASEHMKRSINIMLARENKSGSHTRHLISTLRGLMSSSSSTKRDKAEDEAVKGLPRVSSTDSLKSAARRQSIRRRMAAVNESNESSRGKAKTDLKIYTFKATKSMYGRIILMFITLYGVAVFSLCLSWTLDSTFNASIAPWQVDSSYVTSSMITNMEIMTVVLHIIFFLCSSFVWNGASLQSYVDVAISIALPFVDTYYHRIIQRQGFLSIGQIITLSLLNGYVTFRYYQKTLATVVQTSKMSNESVEHLRFIWTVRTVKVARQLYPEIAKPYEALVGEWGEDYAQKVLDVTIYITDKDRKEAASFRAEIRNSPLFKARKVFFVRPRLPQSLEEHTKGLFETRPAYSSTLLAFCGGPALSGILSEAVSNIKLLSAATGHSAHKIDFVSESYGGTKGKGGMMKMVPRKRDDHKQKQLPDAVNLWDVVKQETVTIVNTKRLQVVFKEEKDDVNEDYQSKRELHEAYHSRRESLSIGNLRHRSSRFILE